MCGSQRNCKPEPEWSLVVLNVRCWEYLTPCNGMFHGTPPLAWHVETVSARSSWPNCPFRLDGAACAQQSPSNRRSSVGLRPGFDWTCSNWFSINQWSFKTPNRFSWRVSLCFPPSTASRLQVPAHEKSFCIMMLPPPCFAMEMCSQHDEIRKLWCCPWWPKAQI